MKEAILDFQFLKNSQGKKGRGIFLFLNLCFSTIYCVFNEKLLRYVTVANGEEYELSVSFQTTISKMQTD